MIMSKITLLVHAGEVEECHVLFSTNLVTDPDQQASCQTLIGTLRHTVSRGKIRSNSSMNNPGEKGARAWRYFMPQF
jgi:hypothetical protein